MNRQLTIFILYIFSLLLTLFISIPFSNYVIIVLTVLFFGYQVYQFLQITKNTPNGEIVFRQQSKSVRILFIILALIPSIGYFINGRFNILQISIFWSIVLFDIIVSILTNKLKPIAIVINGDRLELNNQSKTARNLSSLKAISLNGFTNEINMTFSDQSNLLINQNHFSKNDIQKLIDICIAKSRQALTISDNLKK